MFFTYGEVVKKRLGGDVSFEALDELITLGIGRMESFYNLFNFPIEVRNRFFDAISENVFLTYEKHLYDMKAEKQTEKYII